MTARSAPRKVTAKKPPKIHPYKVRFGTRNEFGPTRTFPSNTAARNAVVEELNDLKPWLLRHNSKGLEAVEAALNATSGMMFRQTPSRIECCFDEHYGMWLVAEYWQETA